MFLITIFNECHTVRFNYSTSTIDGVKNMFDWWVGTEEPSTIGTVFLAIDDASNSIDPSMHTDRTYYSRRFALRKTHTSKVEVYNFGKKINKT